MNIFSSLERLGVLSTRAKKSKRINPVFLEAALARLDRPLTLDEQKVVLRAVGDRSKVRWPDWWEAC
jgi:hypothetical protein